MKKRTVPIILLVCFVVFVFAYLNRPAHTPPGQKPVTPLSFSNFAEFQSAFDAAAAGPRLLVLVSPT